jgi:hypothetical protein
LQSVQGDTGVGGIEQTVERPAAGLHAGGHGPNHQSRLEDASKH